MPLYALGSNGSGQLGINNGDEDVNKPTICCFEPGFDPEEENAFSSAGVGAVNENVGFQVAAGGNHTLVRFKSGAVFVAGRYVRWLGAGKIDKAAETEERHTSVFERVVVTSEDGDVLIDRFKFVAATWEAGFLVSMDGREVYVFGKGERGALGLGEHVVKTGMRRIEGIGEGERTGINSIDGSLGHIVVTLSTGEVWGWGLSRHGQLGEIGKHCIWKPTMISSTTSMHIPFPAQGAVAGKDFTFIIGKKNDTPAQDKVSWSLVGKAKRVNLPETDYPHFNISNCSSISAGWSSLYVLKKDGAALGWGWNSHGQIPDSQIPSLVGMLPGSEHVVGRTTDGKIIAFGWPEHGNCGLDLQAESGQKSRYNELTVPLTDGHGIAGLGAGCSTTFILVGKNN